MMSMDANRRFDRPATVSDEEFAYGTTRPDELMPRIDQIQETRGELALWVDLARHIRVNGFDPMAKVRLSPGVDQRMAARHLGACLATSLPGDERDYRIAALLFRWFESIQIPRGPRISPGVMS